jgi:hypothetical protein
LPVADLWAVKPGFDAETFVVGQFVEETFIAERWRDLVLIAATEPTLDVVVYRALRGS